MDASDFKILSFLEENRIYYPLSVLLPIKKSSTSNLNHLKVNALKYQSNMAPII